MAAILVITTCILPALRLKKKDVGEWGGGGEETLSAPVKKRPFGVLQELRQTAWLLVETVFVSRRPAQE